VWVGSPEKLAADLGWRAATPFEAGLRRTLAWLQADAGRQRFYAERVLRSAAV
jgi:dTDP-D-glucose 4,6-dehydratase